MCGIFCSVFNPDFQKVFTGLKRLEYRGYDSWGFGALTIDTTSPVQFVDWKGLGPLPEYLLDADKAFIACQAILGHCRWATSSQPSIEHAHPIIEGNICVVLNGTIENWRELRDKYGFKGDSDTQILAEWLDCNGGFPGFYELKGSYAFVFIYYDGLTREVNFVVNGSPLYITDDGYISSDLNSLSGISFDQVYKLKEKSWGYYDLKDTGFQVIGGEYIEVVLPTLKQEQFKSEDFHMLSEIKEQGDLAKNIEFERALPIFAQKRNIVCLGAGSSFYASLFCEKVASRYTNIKCRAYYASELEPELPHWKSDDIENSLFVAFTQSAESKDVISTLECIPSENRLCLTNNISGKASQISDYKIDIKCGIEQSVAATKSFTFEILHFLNQLFSVNKNIFYKQLLKCSQEYIPYCLDEVLNDSKALEFSHKLAQYRNIIYLGRDLMFPILMEGALKAKEVVNCFCEAIISSEYRHGPIGLSDSNTPCLFAFGDEEKYMGRIISNVEQVKARGSPVFIVCRESQVKELSQLTTDILSYPDCIWKVFNPLGANFVLQFLAYNIAVHLGKPVDRPRNLAKSLSVF